MSRTSVIIIVGVVLVALFLLVGYLVKTIGLKRSAEDFVLVWFAVAAFNLAVGVYDAGYTFLEELPIFLLIFLVPSVIAVAAWLLAHRSARAR